MNNAPILILQMQRMGDLVLSFPLLGWLGKAFPNHPLWVVGEPLFFEPLMSLSPSVTYFSYDRLPDLTRVAFHAVLNLSHRQEAAALAASLRCDALIGPWLDANGSLFINGDWQLYRASLTHNNRYNRYHWADLNALDIIPPALMLRTDWPRPHRPAGTGARPEGARIGLFLGASEPEKHPDASFWANLARRLLTRGHKPVLLGGQAEAPMGKRVAGMLKSPALNLCGRFSVGELAHFLSELDLFITPDTGPMHIAVWLGTPTLNISMGPVNPFETGPTAPGHHVLRPLLECAGCWRCTEQTVRCREATTAKATAAMAEYLLAGKTESARARLDGRVHGMELLLSGREGHGLHRLTAQAPQPQKGFALRRDIALFWQAWFAEAFGRFTAREGAAARAALKEQHPQTAQAIGEGAAAFALALARTFRESPAALHTAPDFWEQAPSLLRPFSGYAHMAIQNAGGNKAAFTRVLALAESLAELA